MNTFDLTLFHWINRFAGYHPFLDFVMKFFAQYALELYAILFVVAWFTLPKRDTTNRHALVVAGFGGILALLVNTVISTIWLRPRPFDALPPGTFTQLIAHSHDASFPSDHVSGSFGFAAASWGKSMKWVSWSFTLLAVIVMFARVYVGVHYPTDVLAGCVVGSIAGRVMWKFSRYLNPVTSFALRIFRFGHYAETVTSQK